jgi:hypothetical protein
MAQFQSASGMDGSFRGCHGNCQRYQWGINQWTYADQNQNSTNDTFHQGTGGIRVYVYQVNFPGVPGGGDPFQGANYAASTYEGTSIVASQDITLYIGSTCGGQNPYPCWDVNAGNFHTFVQQTIAHEIGHCMGLNDQIGDTCPGQIPGESVMNGQCGTNDAQGTLPAPMLGLPDCDNMSIW